MTPTEARKRIKEQVCHKVRISKYKRKTLDKGYTPNWTEQMFVIDEYKYTYPITNTIKDLNDEEIKQSF